MTAAGDLLESGWLTDGFADAAQSAAHRQRCRQMVEDYVAGLDPAVEPAGVERTVATRTDLIAVSGRIDRLDDRRPGETRPGEKQPGDLVVVDYKTGRHRLTVDDARTSLALALYALAAERVLRRPCRTVELHHLPTGQVLAWEHTPESLARQLRRAEDIAAECAGRRRAVQGRGSRRAAGRRACSSRGPDPAAAGATSARTARRAAPPRRGAAPGTGSRWQATTRGTASAVPGPLSLLARRTVSQSTLPSAD